MTGFGSHDGPAVSMPHGEPYSWENRDPREEAARHKDCGCYREQWAKRMLAIERN